MTSKPDGDCDDNDGLLQVESPGRSAKPPLLGNPGQDPSNEALQQQVVQQQADINRLEHELAALHMRLGWVSCFLKQPAEHTFMIRIRCVCMTLAAVTSLCERRVLAACGSVYMAVLHP